MKKYLNFEFIMGTILFIGLTVIGIAFVFYSYAWSDEYSETLKYFLRIGGIISAVGYPFIYGISVSEYAISMEDED